MNPILVNEEKCVGCELCVKDCPSSYLYIENGKAHTNTGGCLECGHCYAICPQAAITMTNYDCPEEAAVPMTEIPSDTLLSAMKSRRTVRQFTDHHIPFWAADRTRQKRSVLTFSARGRAFRAVSRRLPSASILQIISSSREHRWSSW